MITILNFKIVNFSFRYGGEILDKKPEIRAELDHIIKYIPEKSINISRPEFNYLLDEELSVFGWTAGSYKYQNSIDPLSQLDFIKDRVGVRKHFGHSSFMGSDLLKFQIASNSDQDLIDLGVYIVTTKNFQDFMSDRGVKWAGSLTYERALQYLHDCRKTINVPLLVMGVDL